MLWFQKTLQTYPEIAVFLSLAIGYWVGNKRFKGFSLGAVTGTLLAAIVIGQLNIQISGNVKSIFFLMFLFAIGYGIGPQFIKGIAKDGIAQAVFAVVQCLFSLLIVVLIAKVVGYDMGSAAGLFSGSQTMSAAMGLSTDAINRSGLAPDQITVMLNNMPVAYAVSYIFGTIGSALLLTYLGPILMRVDIAEACKDYAKTLGAGSQIEADSQNTAWHQYILRAYQIQKHNPVIGITVRQLELRFPDHNIFVEGILRGGEEIELSSSVILQEGDILAIGGDHQKVVEIFGNNSQLKEDATDPSFLQQPVEGVDVFVTSRDFDGKTLEALAQDIDAHGVFIRRIKRGALATDIPVLPKVKLHRGDIVTLTGLTRDVEKLAKDLGCVDRKTKVADVAFICGAIFIGAIVGAIVVNVDGIPITLSTAGGTLIAGLIFGWLRSIHPTFGYVPEPTIWFMNSVGLNVFIAVVGLTAGPGFIKGLEAQGLSLFLWGIVATSIPLILGVLVGKYIFKFHPAIVLGCCAGARTTTAALGMVCERAKSNLPSLGYTITYTVGNTLLTLWGMILIIILSR